MVIITKEDDTFSNQTISLDEVALCSQKEADMWIFVHAKNVAEEGSRLLIIKASDTDILVITVSVLPSLQEIGLQQLWIAFVQGCTSVGP